MNATGIATWIITNWIITNRKCHLQDLKKTATYIMATETATAIKN